MTNAGAANHTAFKTVKARIFATLVAIVAAVALPQLFHVVGAVSGLGTNLGQTFLPMHLPVLLVGLLAGPAAGLTAGALSPLASFALSGMPGPVMLPLMMAELAGYGLVAGALAGVKLRWFLKLVLAQVAGRLVFAAAILVLGSPATLAASAWGSIVTGLPGLLLQWSLVPLLMFWVENRD